MAANSTTLSSSGENSTAARRILDEMRSIQTNPIPGLAYVRPRNEDLFTWDVAFFGAPESPYFGGYYKVFYSFLVS